MVCPITERKPPMGRNLRSHPQASQRARSRKACRKLSLVVPLPETPCFSHNPGHFPTSNISSECAVRTKRFSAKRDGDLRQSPLLDGGSGSVWLKLTHYPPSASGIYSVAAQKQIERATSPVCALGWLRGADLNGRPSGYEPEWSILSPADSVTLTPANPPISPIRGRFFAVVLP